MTFYQFLKKTRREAPGRFFTLLFAASFVFWGGIIVLASPPDNPYAPGATLDPDCVPGSANCTVYPPLATGLTATTTVTMSDYPLNFDSGTFYIDSLNNRIGVGTTTPNVALDVIGSSKFSTGIKDNAETPLLSIDTGARKLYASDGVSVGLDYSLAGALSGARAGTPKEGSVFIGLYAGKDVTDGIYSNLFGNYAGYKATNVYEVNFFGDSAGYGAINASDSNFFGYMAGQNATHALRSNFFGVGAGSDAKDASHSNFFGASAGYNARNAFFSNFFGYDAGGDTVNTSHSNFFGHDAGYGAVNAYNSHFFGDFAGYDANNASESIFLGSHAGYNDTVNNSNGLILTINTTPDTVGSGYTVGDILTITSGDTLATVEVITIDGSGGVTHVHLRKAGFSGYTVSALNATSGGTGTGCTVEITSVTNGVLNGTSIAIGRYSGTGGFSNSIAIGHGVINSAALQANIGNVLYLTGIYNSDTQSSTPTATGNVGIGTTTPASKLDVWGNLRVGTSATPALFVDTATGFVGAGTTTPWRKLSVAGTAGFSGLTNDSTGYYLCLNTTTYEMATSTTACGASSLRFKENVQPMTYGLSEILQLNPVFYDWKDTYMPSENKRQIGLIAEEASLIIPELAGYDSQGEPINVDYPKATAVIIKAIQELNEKISSQTSAVSSQLTGSFDGILDWLGDKVVRAKEFVASKITVDKVIVKQGFEIEDALTGEVYCVRIYNGEWEKFKGTCGEISSEISTNDQLPIPNDQSNPNIQNTSEETEQVEPVVEPVAEPPLESAEADLTGQAVVEEPVPEPIVEPVIEEPMSTD